jgi:electron transport complex protein RnfE
VLSIVDGLGMGIGFTLSLTALGAIREILGKGFIPFTDIQVLAEPFEFFQQAPGAFVALGLMLGIMNLLGKK